VKKYPVEKKSETFLIAARAADMRPSRPAAGFDVERPVHGRRSCRSRGTVMLITIFAIALLAALVCGMLQMNMEEIQLAQNHVYAAQALAVAEAGLNDAMAHIRTDDAWTTGFAGKPFGDHAYTVAVSGTLPMRTLESTAVTRHGYTARIAADITVGATSPYVVRIDRLRINE
jgi:Tfp pilus assembly protein PilX